VAIGRNVVLTALLCSLHALVCLVNSTQPIGKFQHQYNPSLQAACVSGKGMHATSRCDDTSHWPVHVHDREHFCCIHAITAHVIMLVRLKTESFVRGPDCLTCLLHGDVKARRDSVVTPALRPALPEQVIPGGTVRGARTAYEGSLLGLSPL
jgi:hypothetical protein